MPFHREAGERCIGSPVRESHTPTLALLVSIYQWCPGFGGTSWTRPDEDLCLPSTDFFYSYFQNQMVSYRDSVKAAGVEGGTLVLHGSKDKKCAYAARLLSARPGTCAHVNSEHVSDLSKSSGSQKGQGVSEGLLYSYLALTRVPVFLLPSLLGVENFPHPC